MVQRIGSAPPQPGTLRVDLVGTVALHGPDPSVGAVPVARPQVQLTLAFLLIERRPVGRGEIADLLWGDRPLSEHWKGAVRGVLSKVRDVLTEAGIAAEILGSRDGTVRLEVPGSLATDLELAAAAVHEGETTLADGDASAALALVSPWTGHLQRELLPAGDGTWVRTQQDRLAALARRAVATEARALLALDQPDEAAERVRSWVRFHPLDETVAELLIAALVEAGRRSEAHECFRDLRRSLADELGVAPAARIGALLQAADRTDGTPGASPERRRGAIAAPAPDRMLLGRRDELDRLRDAWARTVAEGTPRLAVLSGRSGIGKTRLAEELAASARLDGAVVRWARCLPGEALPFEPLASAVGSPGTEPVDRSLATDPSTARVDMLRSIAAGMRALAAEPAVLVLDDLQWATHDVASALEQTLTAVTGPLLVVLTGRDLPATLFAVLDRLQRALPGPRLRLRELELDDLVGLFDDRDDERALAEAAALHRRTGGHPFFVSEVALAPRRIGRPVDPEEIPDAVREWLGHRADALPPTTRACLDLAAVVGEECRTSTVARCAGLDPDETLEHLEALVAEGFLVETDRVDVFAFAHLITHDTTYERVGTTRRARLHATVAAAFAAEPPAPGRHAVIAGHLRAAGPDHADEAGRRLLLAGREALDSGAWSLAERLFRDAHEVAADDPVVRSGALTGTARALHLQRRRDEAEALIDESLAVARAHRLPLELAEAALVLVGRAGRGATQRLSDLEQAELLREALAGLEALDGAAESDDPIDRPDPRAARVEQVRRASLACQVEGELALALSLTAPVDERRPLAERAVARARALDPPDTHLTARTLLISRLARLDLASLAGRLDDLDQVLAIAPAGRSVDTTLAALTYRAEDLAVCGRRAESRRSLAEAVALANQSGHPYWSWATSTWQGLDALIDGDLEAAEHQAFASSSMDGSDEGGALACLGVNLVNLRLYQGRSGEVLDLLQGAADASPHIPCYRAVHALCAAAAGELEAARRSYDHFRADGFTTIPEDTNRLLTVTVLADAAVRLGDDGSVAALRELLLPAAGLQAILNCYGGGGAYWGPVAHQLARLAVLAGDVDGADRWFADAEASARRMEAPLALARIVDDPVRTRRPR